MHEPGIEMEPDNPSRRHFLEWASAALLGLATVALAPPFAISFVGPSLDLSSGDFAEVGPIGNLVEGKPTDMPFSQKATDAYISTTELRSVWVVKGKTEADMKVFSPICPHLGCQYEWEASKNQFHCPCHGSIFAPDGKVLGGPAPRPLDTLEHQIADGKLSVKWEKFKLGVSAKIPV